MARLAKFSLRPCGEERAQIFAELAVVLPLMTFLLGGMIQIGMLGYGAGLAHYASFATLRAAAVRPELRGKESAHAFAAKIINRAPGLNLITLDLSVPGESLLAATVRLRVPRMAPFLPSYLATVQARCAMRMEPTW